MMDPTGEIFLNSKIKPDNFVIADAVLKCKNFVTEVSERN